MGRAGRALQADTAEQMHAGAEVLEREPCPAPPSSASSHWPGFEGPVLPGSVLLDASVLQNFMWDSNRVSVFALLLYNILISLSYSL